MVKISFSEKFERILKKLKDNTIKLRIIKQVEKIKLNPEIGKPLRNVRKGTRELYIPPFRLSYAYLPDKQEVVILDIYHKDQQ